MILDFSVSAEECHITPYGTFTCIRIPTHSILLKYVINRARLNKELLVIFVINWKLYRSHERIYDSWRNKRVKMFSSVVPRHIFQLNLLHLWRYSSANQIRSHYRFRLPLSKVINCYSLYFSKYVQNRKVVKTEGAY